MTAAVSAATTFLVFSLCCFWPRRRRAVALPTHHVCTRFARGDHRAPPNGATSAPPCAADVTSFVFHVIYRVVLPLLRCRLSRTPRRHTWRRIICPWRTADAKTRHGTAYVYDWIFNVLLCCHKSFRLYNMNGIILLYRTVVNTISHTLKIYTWAYRGHIMRGALSTIEYSLPPKILSPSDLSYEFIMVYSL